VKIIEVQAGWSETVSLPGYANARPSVAFTAVVEDDEDPEEIRRQLLETAKQIVRQEVDAVLMEHDRPPKYYDGPRYDVVESVERRAVVIVPSGEAVPRDFWIKHADLPLQTARAKALERAEGKGWAILEAVSRSPNEIFESLYRRQQEESPF
jgi:hypothetical protein